MNLNFYHYRNKDQDEADIIMENDGDEIVVLEVKAAATVATQDFEGLRKVAAATGQSFKARYVLYDGEIILPFKDRLAAISFSFL